MIKLYKSDDRVSLKEREYVDDAYTVVSKESMNMEDDLRGIYVDDSLDALEDELSAEGFEYYDEGICIAPADCLYRIWKNDKYKIIIYFGNDDNIVYNLYVKEKDTTLESVCSRKRKLREQDVEIEVKHEGILEVPEGKNVEDLPIKHFVDLAKKKGLSKITKALNNLQVWNKKKNPSLSKWAGDMIDKVSKKMEKNESVSRKTVTEEWHDGDAIITFARNDDLEVDLEELLFDIFKDNPDAFDLDWFGGTTHLYLSCSEEDYKYIKWFIEDWKYKHRDEYDESLKEDYIDGEYADIDSLSRRYRKMMQSGELDDIIALYHEVGGDFDEFVIEAVQRGFSILDVMCFSVCNDGISINNFKHRLRMLGMLDESLKESSMYDYYDVPDGAFDMHNDMPTPEDEWWASIPSELRAVVHEMEEQGWEGVGFTTTGVDYCLSKDDKNRPELSYEMCVSIYDRDTSVSLSRYVEVYNWEKEKEISRIPNTSGVAEFRTPQDVKKFSKWFNRLGTDFATT